MRTRWKLKTESLPKVIYKKFFWIVLFLISKIEVQPSRTVILSHWTSQAELQYQVSAPAIPLVYSYQIRYQGHPAECLASGLVSRR
jgi:hypothetical protein